MAGQELRSQAKEGRRRGRGRGRERFQDLKVKAEPLSPCVDLTFFSQQQQKGACEAGLGGDG